MAYGNALWVGPENDPFSVRIFPCKFDLDRGTYVTFRQSLKSTSLPCGLELVSREFLSPNNKPRRGCRIVRAWNASPTILRIAARGGGRGGRWGERGKDGVRREGG